MLALGVPGLLALVLAGCLPSAVVPHASDLPEEESPPPVAIGTCPWPVEETPATPPTTAADPVAATEAIALDAEAFWGVIESIPDLPAPDDFGTVSSALAGCPVEDIIAFDARLTLALYALDGPENLAWYEKYDPMGLGFVSDDTFLSARCATVLAGRETWANAIHGGTLDWGPDSPDLDGMGEFLLYVGMDAANAQGIDWEEYLGTSYEAIPLSYESGSNTGLWGE
jgi:hypothetical protein